MKNKRFITLVTILLCLCCLTGCEKINRDTKIVLTTGFTKDEIFRIETASCYKREVMVYLTNLQNQYEQVYGTEIWQQEQDGVTIEQSVKESVLAELAQIKTMNLMAENYGLSLNNAEQEMVDEAAKVYFDSLTAAEKEELDITLDTIRQLYREYALADKVYDYIIQDVNPEISDDEARTVVLQQIFVKTGERGRDGNIESYSVQQKSYAYAQVAEALRRIESGEDFDVVATRYNEAKDITVSVRKDEMDAAYEKAAFELGNDEISSIIETEEGYYILKCISTLNREETDANKEKVVEERKKEAFSREYDSYVQTLTRHMNEELWQEVTLLHNSEITTSDFFDVFAEYYRAAK
ncbi:MAG: peptidylprolyl isomerase [Lachnospiraceae bacterium]|nr:peptidylprolyl isomerase [Lachnospiraceae bacterium]